MGIYREIMEFVRGKIRFYEDYPQDLKEHVVMDFADCVEEYINEYIERVPEDKKMREYILDIALNYCFEAYARDHGYEEEDDEPEYEEEDDDEEEDW